MQVDSSAYFKHSNKDIGDDSNIETKRKNTLYLFYYLLSFFVTHRYNGRQDKQATKQSNKQKKTNTLHYKKCSGGEKHVRLTIKYNEQKVKDF